MITDQGYTTGKLLDGAEYLIDLDTRACWSFLSKTHNLICKSLHSLPKFACKTKNIQADNRLCVSVLFIKAMILVIHDHIFEIYT